MRDILVTIMYVFMGGGLGASARYLAALGIQRFTGSSFPFGTMFVNVTGSFIIGLTVFYFESRGTTFQHWRPFIIVGILGGFTTFSSFSLDTLILFKNDAVFSGLANIAGNVLLCLAAVWLGSVAGRQMGI